MLFLAFWKQTWWLIVAATPMGAFLNTLTLVDISTGWLECIPLLRKGAGDVIDGLCVADDLLPFPLQGLDTDCVRWSWFVGQSKGKLKVYSDWFLALDERTLPMARDDVKGIVGSSVGALVKCRSVMTGSTLPVMINHFATAVAVSPEGPERSGGAA